MRVFQARQTDSALFHTSLRYFLQSYPATLFKPEVDRKLTEQLQNKTKRLNVHVGYLAGVYDSGITVFLFYIMCIF